MVIKESDIGPFWLSEQEMLEQRNDKIEHGKKVKRKLRKEELVKKLAEAGVTATGNYATIQRLAVEQNIATVEEDLPKIKIGWVGKLTLFHMQPSTGTSIMI